MAANGISIRPKDGNDVDSILKAIAVSGEKVSKNDPGARVELLEQARQLVVALESPLETIFHFILGEPARMFVARMALDFKIFETLAEDNGRFKSAKELAAPTGANEKLVARVLRHLVAMKMVAQKSADEFGQNELTKYLQHPKYREGICYSFDAVGPSLSKMPEYLSNTKWQNPQNTNDGPFQYAHKTPGHWVWLEQHPRVEQAFHDYLIGVREDRPNFMDEGFYPVEERLLKDLKTTGEGAAFVDVGGGTGHALSEFKEKVPSWNGRLVLQEQESVVKISKNEPYAHLIEAQVHNFFTPNPLKGARAYYMRYILHDWPDEECRTILKHLKDAMEPGYSKILIHECVVDDVDPSWQHTALDVFMMALFATQERTESEWRTLLESVGLKITGIWSKGKGNLSLIEAELQ